MTDFQDHLLATFREEAAGYIESFTAGLLALESDLESSARRELLDELFRKAHSLKGAAQVTGLLETRDLANQLENALDAMRHAETEIDPTAYDPLYGLVDSIARSVQVVKTTPAEPVRSTQETHSALSESPPPEMDIVSSSNDATPAMRTVDSVRVSTAKLDALFDSAQELLLALRRTDHWLTTLDNLYQMLRDWQRQEELNPTLTTAGESVANYRGNVREHLTQLEQYVADTMSTIARDSNTVHRVANTLQNRVMETRMQPAETLVALLRRAIRDLSSQTKKPITFNVEGELIEVDRFVLEALRDPLIHLLRNAVDHGIERAAIRAQQAKPETGTITLRFSVIGSYLRVEIADDGAGMNPDDLRRTAVRNNLLSAQDAEHANMQQLVALAMTPGFTTRTEVSDLSGRGMGLNVVQRQVEMLHGVLAVQSTPGAGTRILLQVPLTLLTIDALIVMVAGQALAIPLTTVSRVMRVRVEDLGNINGRPVLSTPRGTIAVFSLATLLELPGKLPSKGPVSLLITGDVSPIALQVDTLEGEQPVVVRQLGFPLKRVRNISGATLMDDGRPAAIVNISDVIKSAERRMAPALTATTTIVDRPSRILVVDDSITTRTLEKQILEHKGYDVSIAVNGQEALNILREAARRIPFDLVISDLMMPVMNGYELTEAIRKDEVLEHLPVVLVTSMGSVEDRRHGMEAGADAYVVKSQFDQDQLLATIRRLIG